MSKSISVTLPNIVADTLEEYLKAGNKDCMPGFGGNRSKFVSQCVIEGLAKVGYVISEDKITKPEPVAATKLTPPQREPGYDPL